MLDILAKLWVKFGADAHMYWHTFCPYIFSNFGEIFYVTSEKLYLTIIH